MKRTFLAKLTTSSLLSLSLVMGQGSLYANDTFDQAFIDAFSSAGLTAPGKYHHLLAEVLKHLSPAERKELELIVKDTTSVDALQNLRKFAAKMKEANRFIKNTDFHTAHFPARRFHARELASLPQEAFQVEHLVIEGSSSFFETIPTARTQEGVYVSKIRQPINLKTPKSIQISLSNDMDLRCFLECTRASQDLMVNLSNVNSFEISTLAKALPRLTKLSLSVRDEKTACRFLMSLPKALEGNEIFPDITLFIYSPSEPTSKEYSEAKEAVSDFVTVYTKADLANGAATNSHQQSLEVAAYVIPFAQKLFKNTDTLEHRVDLVNLMSSYQPWTLADVVERVEKMTDQSWTAEELGKLFKQIAAIRPSWRDDVMTSVAHSRNDDFDNFSSNQEIIYHTFCRHEDRLKASLNPQQETCYEQFSATFIENGIDFWEQIDTLVELARLCKYTPLLQLQHAVSLSFGKFENQTGISKLKLLMLAARLPVDAQKGFMNSVQSLLNEDVRGPNMLACLILPWLLEVSPYNLLAAFEHASDLLRDNMTTQVRVNLISGLAAYPPAKMQGLCKAASFLLGSSAVGYEFKNIFDNYHLFTEDQIEKAKEATLKVMSDGANAKTRQHYFEMFLFADVAHHEALISNIPQLIETLKSKGVLFEGQLLPVFACMSAADALQAIQYLPAALTEDALSKPKQILNIVSCLGALAPQHVEEAAPHVSRLYGAEGRIPSFLMGLGKDKATFWPVIKDVLSFMSEGMTSDEAYHAMKNAGTTSAAATTTTTTTTTSVPSDDGSASEEQDGHITAMLGDLMGLLGDDAGDLAEHLQTIRDLGL